MTSRSSISHSAMIVALIMLIRWKNRKQVPDSYSQKDFSIMFTIQTKVEGDFLIRCRHYRSGDERVSSFRLMLNSAFILDEILRFKKVSVDVFSAKQSLE